MVRAEILDLIRDVLARELSHEGAALLVALIAGAIRERRQGAEVRGGRSVLTQQAMDDRINRPQPRRLLVR
jgi:hypothetical protein